MGQYLHMLFNICHSCSQVVLLLQIKFVCVYSCFVMHFCIKYWNNRLMSGSLAQTYVNCTVSCMHRIADSVFRWLSYSIWGWETYTVMENECKCGVSLLHLTQTVNRLTACQKLFHLHKEQSWPVCVFHIRHFSLRCGCCVSSSQTHQITFPLCHGSLTIQSRWRLWQNVAVILTQRYACGLGVRLWSRPCLSILRLLSDNKQVGGKKVWELHNGV